MEERMVKKKDIVSVSNIDGRMDESVSDGQKWKNGDGKGEDSLRRMDKK